MDLIKLSFVVTRRVVTEDAQFVTVTEAPMFQLISEVSGKGIKRFLKCVMVNSIIVIKL